MTQNIQTDRFTNSFIMILEEAFDQNHGIFLDPETSLLDTLATVSAEEASRPVGGKCAALSAQVAHVTLFLEVLEKSILGEDSGEVDWGVIWDTVQEVSPKEWVELQDNLKKAYMGVWAELKEIKNWDDEALLGNVLAILAHSVYHLGEIRQALCTIK